MDYIYKKFNDKNIIIDDYIGNNVVDYYNQNYKEDVFNILIYNKNYNKLFEYTIIGSKFSWNELPKFLSYNESMEKLKYWEEVSSNKKIKLLKDLKGNVWIVSLVDSLSYNVDQRSGLYPTEINFNWEEIQSNNIPIINYNEGK